MQSRGLRLRSARPTGRKPKELLSSARSLLRSVWGIAKTQACRQYLLSTLGPSVQIWAQLSPCIRRSHLQVVMSEHQRRTVESAIQSLSSARDIGEGRVLNGSSVTTEAAENQLISLGFEVADVQKAYSAMAPGPKVLLTEVLDWLCLHLPEHRLPVSFTSGTLLGF